MSLDDLLPIPTEDDRAARRADLVARARRVLARGWDDYLFTWSIGEASGVALLLNDDLALADLGESRTDVLDRYAYDLFGVSEARADIAVGAPATTNWFRGARTDLDS